MRVISRLALPAVCVAAALGFAQSQRPEIGPPPHSASAADAQLPNGKYVVEVVLPPGYGGA